VRRLLAAGAIVHLAAAAATIVYRRVIVTVWVLPLRITDVNQMLLRGAVCFAALLAVSPAARARTRMITKRYGFFAVALIGAMWLSLGPNPQVLGRPLEIFAPYGVLYQHVPGFQGLRAPARFAMIALVMLSVLAGFGANILARTRRLWVLLPLLAIGAFAEALVLPFTVNGDSVAPPGYNMPESRVYRPARAPDVYKEVARQPADTVVVELPLGDPTFDLRAVYYSTVHWRPVLNGYSGFYPSHYGRLVVALDDVPRFPDVALQALRVNGATHVIVHESAYLDDRGTRTTAALQRGGAVELYRNGADVLLKLP
jgi:hypothetical protein